MVERNFPFDFLHVDPVEIEEMKKYCTGYRGGYVRVGPKGYFMPDRYKRHAADIYNMPLRDSDVYIVTYARSGTTLTQEMIWLIANDLDYEKAAAAPLIQRFPYLEFSTLFDHEEEKYLSEYNKHSVANSQLLQYITNPGTELQAKASSPRFIKSHLPLSLLPPALLDTTKVVYVARDPRDVAVSFYNLYCLFKTFNYTGDFKTYWNYFIKDMVVWCPFFEHVKEAWEKRHHPNLLFLFYEDIVKDMAGSIRRMAAFLGKQLEESQINRLCAHLSIENFKHNKTVNDTAYRELGCLTDWNQPFIRKGKPGGWRECFDAEMCAQAQRWMEHNLRDTDLRFPEKN